MYNKRCKKANIDLFVTNETIILNIQSFTKLFEPFMILEIWF